MRLPVELQRHDKDIEANFSPSEPQEAQHLKLLRFVERALSQDTATSGTPPVDNAGPVDVPVTVTDSNGGTTTITVTLNPTNPAPVANDQAVTASFEKPLQINLLGNDRDPDGDPIRITHINGVALTGADQLIAVPNGLVFVDGTTRVITLTPDAGFSGDIFVPYTIEDQDGDSDTATHSITVAEGPPVHSIQPVPATPSVVGLPEVHSSIEAEGIVLETVRDIGGLSLNAVDLSERGIVLDTVNALGSLGGLQTASSGGLSIGTTIDDISRLEELRDNGARAFPGHFASWNAESLVGFSIRMDVAGSSAAGDSTANGQIIVDTLMRDRILYVEIDNTFDLGEEKWVTGYSIVQTDGNPLPGWIHQADKGLLLAEVPATGGELNVRIAAQYSDGSTTTRAVTLQLATGEVQEFALEGEDTAKTFGQQLRDGTGGR